MKNNTPKYLEIVNFIKEKIESKELKPGQKIYSENELSKIFKLSRQTVRHSISVLEKEGIVRKVQGSGTYVADNRLTNLENKTRIAVITTYVDSYIFPRTIKGIENYLFEKGFSVQIAFTNNVFAREKIILEDILNRNDVAGIIAEPTKSGLPNLNEDLISEITSRHIPVVFINSYYADSKLPHVSINDKEAGRKATEYLISMGHRKIGAILKLDDGQGHLRFKGYSEAMMNADLDFLDTDIVWIDTEEVKHLEKTKGKILERLGNCTGILCYNDEVSYSLIEILKKEGMKVPEDISIVSIDNSELAVLSDVEFTSIPHPMERLGEKAAENLIQLIKNPSFDANYEFDEDIIIRDSVKRISR
ncbi:GntR family transcriptional regulator [Anaerosacchariphilus polymeriproducens]|uniref:GntR family transcriptional regulator n=1 Tax=Anaerosacchariphilus polymeriproducens TaxID=1812858 RepID=A0A371AT31_9FIRM|nr:GntR family transcriptional regulator [Anaerosacchariphilus polymeriproducens]RDU22620.1 GntR family transcriptional regulator [Anaerosacchariphilus polymeriproducens]